jgi:serine/threonine protein kinase/Tfp pilus assembly protein PilF
MAIKCPKCQTDNLDNQKFCGECATPLPSSEDIQISQTKTLETPAKELTRGTLFAGRYEIIEELGKGGMGRVYRVEDKKLDQEVALKLIKSEVAKDKKTIERFRNELKTARMIAHKNVCRMFDLGEDEGAYFITMEYIRGEDLKSFIHRSGQLAAGTSIRIAKQICDGLSEAHKLGVVHRDLKSNNIMIDKEGNARIMDFGIARSAEGKKITGAGVMIGTPEYMSPEQVEAKEVDQRSDIYSLGIILYEMLTGRVPFEGDTPFTIGVKHKSEIPKNPKELNTHISDDLSSLILRCLEKDKGERYQSAAEVRSQLTDIKNAMPTTEKIGPAKKSITSKEITVTIGIKKLLAPVLVVLAIVVIGLIIWKPWASKELSSTSTKIPSIAILPFEDSSPEKDQAHFCNGLAESIINMLTKVQGLRVPAKTSSFSFKDKKSTIQEIGERLDVDTILEGSVQKSGDRVRISARLVNVADESHLWSEQYDSQLNDVFAVQDKIALAITDNLKVHLGGDEKEAVTKRHTDNAEAYNLYLLGRHFWNKRTLPNVLKSIEYFKKAVELDPEYALAYSGIADAYVLLPVEWATPPREAYPKAQEYAQKALAIDDKLAEAYSCLAAIKREFEYDWSGAERYYKRAIELNPNYATAHQWYAEFLTSMGRFDEALDEIHKAQMLDPLSPIISTVEILVLYHARQYDRALESAQKVLELDPNFGPPHIWSAFIYKQKQNYDAYFSENLILENLLKDVNPKSIEMWEQAYDIFKSSGIEDAARYLIKSLKIQSEYTYIPTAWFITHYSTLEDKEQVMDLLEKCYQERSWPIFLLKVTPVVDFVRSEPRFKALLKKVNLDK